MAGRLQAVIAFLQTNVTDAPEIERRCDAISVRLTVRDAETLFATTIYLFTNDKGHQIRRARSLEGTPERKVAPGALLT